MNSLNIINLNDDCLGYIFQYLDIKDHISLIQVCKRFRHVIRDWVNMLYPEFTIDGRRLRNGFKVDRYSLKREYTLFNVASENVRKLCIDISHEGAKNQFGEDFPMNHFCERMENMYALESVSLRAITTYSTSNIQKNNEWLKFNQKMIERIVFSLKDLTLLSRFSISLTPGCNIISLCQLTSLVKLSLNVTMHSLDLVICCKSIEGLRVLWLQDSCIKGELTDIVPYCQNLEEICFNVDRDSESYVKLAQLPSLKILIIRKQSQTISLFKLLSAFSSSNLEQTLQCLKIHDCTLEFNETEQIVGIQSLKELECSLTNSNCVEILQQLTKIQILCIRKLFYVDCSAAFWNIIQSCKDLQLLHIENNYIANNFLHRAQNILKAIRNPAKQKPLRLEHPVAWPYLEDEGPFTLDEAYLSLNRPPFYEFGLPSTWT